MTDNRTLFIELISSVRLERPGNGALPKGTIIVRDLDTALRTAGLKGDAHVEERWYWSDLRENLIGPFGAYPENLAEHFDAMEQFFTSKGEFNIPAEVNGDFRLIAGELLTKKKKTPLSKLLQKAYAAGGWPCGWSGKYPEGHLIVYWPYDVPPKYES